MSSGPDMSEVNQINNNINNGTNTTPNTTNLSQQLQQLTLSSNTTKIPMLKKDEYEIWAMKMQNWIESTDYNLWNVILNGGSAKKWTQDSKGAFTMLPPATAAEALAVQRENKARTTLLQAIPDDYIGEFHYIADPKQLWIAIKAKFGGNEDSKRMRKSMLKQEFQEFRVTE